MNLQRAIHLVKAEISVVFQVIRYDLSSTLVPASLFTLAAFRHAGASVSTLPMTVLKCVAYFFLFAFTFCLSNQWMGIEEDRINKPDRLLVHRRLSGREIGARWAIGMVLYTAVGAALGVLGWTLLWQFLTCLHNFGGWDRQWFTKNLVNGLGVIVQLAASWGLVAPVPVAMWGWILFLAVAIFVLAPLQDLRDIEGDRRAGRRTLPIAWGEAKTRAFLGVAFTLAPIFTHFMLIRMASATPAVIAVDVALAAISLLIAARVAVLRTRRQDHATYLWLTIWFCLALASAILLQ